MNKVKIIFLGTPQFAVPILKKLAQSEFRPAAVFTAPDKPIGRKQILTAPPVKISAQQLKISVFQPKNKKELEEQIEKLQPDLIISAAYGIILTKKILEIPKFSCLNIHPSLLPKYRGASPIHSAILNGDNKTGITIFKMAEEIDNGAIIAQMEFPISQNYTTPEISNLLAKLGADLLLQILPDWIDGEITLKEQHEKETSFSKIIRKEDGKINWQNSAEEIERQIRAYTPWPGTFSELNGKKLKIISAEVSKENSNKKTGEVFLDKNNNVAIQTSDGILIPETVQLEGGKITDAKSFLRGHKETIGEILE